MNISTCVEHHAIRHPGRTAVDDDGRRALTYAELRERVVRLANRLVELGVRPGDRVAIFVFNRLEVVELLVATAHVGAIATPLNFRLSEHDLRSILHDAAPTIVVTQRELHELVADVAHEISAAVVLLGDEYETDLLAASTRPPALPTPRAEDDVLIQYTSGTTGRSKGAVFTNTATLMHAANVALEYGLDAASRVLVSIPHNSATNIQTIPALYAGCTIVFSEVRSFDGAEWIDRVGRLRASHSQVVPTMLYRVLESWRRAPFELPTMRRLGYGSAPIPPERVRELLDAFGSIFIQLYGMIEIAAMGTMLRPEEHEQALATAPDVLGSVGRPSYGIDVRVLDDECRPVADRERGEVAFSTPYMMRGYWGAPDLTAATIREGWLHSGDIGEYRDGWLHLVDRKKDLIIRGGQNIASKEIEEALYAHPAVMESAVVGVPEPEWGESIVAVVVLRPGMSATGEELLRACATGGLPRFKMPTRVELVDELPRNAIGKVQKGELRSRYAEVGA
jgi:fatty-acyl-CoA synthase